MSNNSTETTAPDGGGEQSDTASQRGRATSNRRQFIALGAGATTVLLAGCSSGDDSDGSENGNDSENGNENGGETGNGNDSGNGGETGNGNDSGNGSENGSENGEENGSENGSENGEENGSENGSENGEEEPAPAELSVSSVDIDGQGSEATVESGGGGQVAVTVANVGEQADSFDVALSAGGVSRSQTVELGGGESQTLTFEGLLSALGPGEQSLSVAANGEEVSGATDATVTVEEPAQPATPAFSALDIAGQGTEATVEAGTEGAISVTVENVGEQTGSFDVALSASGVSRSQTVGLEVGASQTLTFEGVVAGLEPGTHEITITAGDEELVGQVTVEESEPETTDGEEFRSQFVGGTAYEFEITSSQGTVTGRFRDGNQYLQFQGGQATGEFYLVDETVYSVQNGRCLIIPRAPVNTTQPPEEDELEDADLSSITRAGTDTIGGEEVIVYEASGAGFGPEGATYYLLADSGRLRRMEYQGPQGQQQVDFLAWGEAVDPITPPDLNCTNPRNA